MLLCNANYVENNGLSVPNGRSLFQLFVKMTNKLSLTQSYFHTSTDHFGLTEHKRLLTEFYFKKAPSVLSVRTVPTPHWLSEKLLCLMRRQEMPWWDIKWDTISSPIEANYTDPKFESHWRIRHQSPLRPLWALNTTVGLSEWECAHCRNRNSEAYLAWESATNETQNHQRRHMTMKHAIWRSIINNHREAKWDSLGQEAHRIKERILLGSTSIPTQSGRSNGSRGPHYSAQQAMRCV